MAQRLTPSTEPDLTAKAAVSPASGLTFRHVFVILAALTVVRLIGLWLSQADLYVDEAQYWAWSRELAFGYFSKPPLLAWIIAGSDLVCGSGEACVRASSPVLYFATSLVTYAVARALYDERTACWTALLLALATGVSFSSRIISTDVPLLLFWAIALLAFVKLMRGPSWGWALALGLALGFGLLAKYAMVYFVLCAVCAAWFDRDARAVVSRPQTWVALPVALAILAPNLWWVVSNGFVTFRHTGGNITGSGFQFHPFGPVAFLASQFILPGPLVYAAFLALVARAVREHIAQPDKVMLAFAVPPLALIAALGFARNPNANWAAMAVIAMVVVVTALWVRGGEWRWIKVSIAIGLAVQALMIAGDAFAYRISIPGLGHNADLYHRTLGWRELGVKTAALARAAQAKTVTSEPRAEVASLIYYLRDDPVQVLSWSQSKEPADHFDLTRALTDKAPQPVLYIGACAKPGRLKQFYGEVTPLGEFTTTAGPHTTRRYYAFKMAQPKRPIAPLGPCR
ncbi:MAG: hypothetical protein OJF62_001525 [Pseudolabrys sp.]|nr:hypothetical protein [Pseudolabrys sp.]